MESNGNLRYIYKGRKINDAELDRLCLDGIKRKIPVQFHKEGRLNSDGEINLILTKAQCLGARGRAPRPAMTVRRVDSAATQSHATPPHRAGTPP